MVAGERGRLENCRRVDIKLGNRLVFENGKGGRLGYKDGLGGDREVPDRRHRGLLASTRLGRGRRLVDTQGVCCQNVVRGGRRANASWKSGGIGGGSAGGMRSLHLTVADLCDWDDVLVIYRWARERRMNRRDRSADGMGSLDLAVTDLGDRHDAGCKGSLDLAVADLRYWCHIGCALWKLVSHRAAMKRALVV
jgi:hypothetical protein